MSVHFESNVDHSSFTLDLQDNRISRFELVKARSQLVNAGYVVQIHSVDDIAGIEIPVAVLGVAGYASILAVLLLEQRIGFLQESGSLVLFGLSLMGFLFTLYLIYVEIALIKAYCPFCIASQSAMILIFILSVIRVVRQS